jgi:hypothetical protein
MAPLSPYTKTLSKSKRHTMSNKFLLKNKEDADKNQYWYSSSTIETVCNFCSVND